MSKKFYWIKLKDDFFKQLAIKKLRKLAGGDTFTIIYLKMMLLSMNNNGKIAYECEQDEFIENLALDMDEEEGNVALTLAFLKANKLLEYVGDGEVFLPSVPDCTGGETEGAERVRKHRQVKREKEKALENFNNVAGALQCNNDVTEQKQKRAENVTLEIRDKRIEKDIDKDIDIDINKVVVVNNNIEPPPKAETDEIIDFWNKNIHPITPFEAEMLQDLVKDYGEVVVKQAMQQACNNNVRKLAYVKATATDIANGGGFQSKKTETAGDYWATLFKGVNDGDNKG